MVRRSARSKAVSKTYKDLSDSESEHEASNAEESDFEQEQPVAKSRKRTQKTTRGPGNKRQKKQTTQSLEDLESELEENYLYSALSHANVEVSDIVLEWIESYEEDQENDTQEAITMLINLLLRCCGSVHLFQPHDLVNLESCAQTVAELTMAFSEQTAHRYPFKAVATFKSNVLEFFDKVIQTAHEKGLLYSKDAEDSDEEDEETSLASPLMQYILTWITSLTTSTIRSLRFTATETIFSIQAQLCRIIKNVDLNLEKHTKQLNKIKPTNKSRYTTVRSIVQNYEKQRDTIIEYFDDIGRIVVSIRYRDPDPQIRLSCLKYLSECMSIYPQHFCKDTYLKYFGWLLSDPIGSVRTENCRVLLKLYKHLTFSASTPILRLFTEKFKLQLIKMSKLDSDAQVRIYSLGICSELFRLGFLEDEDVTTIINTYKMDNLSKGNLSKLQHEYGKFIHELNEKRVNELQEKYNIFLETYKCDQFEDLQECLKIKSLIELTSSIEGNIADLYSSLCSISTGNWEFLVRYFLTDISSVKFVQVKEENNEDEENDEIEEFRQFIDLNDSNRVCLLKFIQGSLAHMLSSVKTPKDEEETSNLLVKLIDHLPKLYTKSMKSSNLFSVFLSIWTRLISETKDSINLFNLFGKLDRSDVYDNLTDSIMKFYKEADLVDEFEEYFHKLFETNALTSTSRAYVQNILSELVVEINDTVTQQEDDFTFGEDSMINDELSVQRSLIKKMSLISPALMKIKQLGNHINISNLERIGDLNEILIQKVLRKLDLAIIISEWKYNFIQKLPDFMQSVQKLFDLLLVVLSWKFEKLIELPIENQFHKDIEVEFDGFVDLVNQMIRLIFECKDHNLVDLKTLLATKYIDLMLYFRIFYVKFSQENQFENFQSFYDNNLQVLLIRQDIQYELLELFLIKEVRLAHELNVDLDRSDEEDVNYDDYIESQPQEAEVSIFDEEQETETRPSSAENSRVWKYEKELTVYTLKLISLVHVSVLQEDIYARIKLNANKFGSLFSMVITRATEQQEKNKQSLQERVPVIEEQEGNIEEPMEEPVVDVLEEPVVEPMVDVLEDEDRQILTEEANSIVV
ncbi:Cohesin subunit SCC3 [Spathaspora sp. JA1]|nr:Cohesin subunit SCC3 [Spathaspora sp. JA1]